MSGVSYHSLPLLSLLPLSPRPFLSDIDNIGSRFSHENFIHVFLQGLFTDWHGQWNGSTKATESSRLHFKILVYESTVFSVKIWWCLTKALLRETTASWLPIADLDGAVCQMLQCAQHRSYGRSPPPYLCGNYLTFILCVSHNMKGTPITQL